nr:ribose 5-phosphate isomerase, type A [Tanacetum cinerariifolium]GEX43851.1 ribose 5-phosphate isomerase, type A [Tanacetum cinerariifolium]
MTAKQMYKLKGGEKRRFCIPQRESVDKVLSAMFSVKRRTLKYRMRGEGLADENRFLKEKVDNQTKEIHTHKKQLEICNKELETCKKQLASQNKKVESYKKQVETQGLQMKNMDQKLNEVYGMLKLLPAFPDLDNVVSTSAPSSCDKQPFSSPSPFMDKDHYSPVMDHPLFGY